MISNTQLLVEINSTVRDNSKLLAVLVEQTHDQGARLQKVEQLQQECPARLEKEFEDRTAANGARRREKFITYGMILAAWAGVLVTYLTKQ